MLDCRQTLRRLHRYLDRDLTDDEVAEVKKHLANCPPCGRHVRLEESIRRLVRAKAACDCAPDHLRASIVEAWRRVSR